nr:5'-nucleotidase domain-containing protein 1 [Leptinotarsa decemlineata]
MFSFLHNFKSFPIKIWKIILYQNKIRIANESRLFSSISHSNYGHRMRGTSKFSFTDYDCIGFDLDNTLARYKVGNMIEMEYSIVSNYLVKKKGYSDKFLLQPLDHNFIMKGLIVDDENGNLIRISPDGKILQATHGTKWLSDEEILRYYPNRHWKATDLFVEDPLQTWNGPYSERMRTLLDYFDIVISLAFARAVDSLDANGGNKKVYEIWPDLLDSLIYMFNRDHFKKNIGEYFPEVKKNPENYYYKCSENLINWLQTLKNNGKRLFLITGAHVDFASLTASNTLGANWRDYFDIVVCYSKKPGFFTMKRDFIGLDGLHETGPVALEDLQVGGIYTHGNWNDLKMFMKKVSYLEDPKILYIGDNLVQDIYTPNVHSKVDTVAVCEELEAERTHGFAEKWHPDEQFLCSSIWGSYFHCKDKNMITNWYHIMKTHSRMCVPSLEYLASFPVNHTFEEVN